MYAAVDIIPAASSFSQTRPIFNGVRKYIANSSSRELQLKRRLAFFGGRKNRSRNSILLSTDSEKGVVTPGLRSRYHEDIANLAIYCVLR